MSITFTLCSTHTNLGPWIPGQQRPRVITCWWWDKLGGIANQLLLPSDTHNSSEKIHIHISMVHIHRMTELVKTLCANAHERRFHQDIFFSWIPTYIFRVKTHHLTSARTEQKRWNIRTMRTARFRISREVYGAHRLTIHYAQVRRTMERGEWWENLISFQSEAISKEHNLVVWIFFTLKSVPTPQSNAERRVKWNWKITGKMV